MTTGRALCLVCPGGAWREEVERLADRVLGGAPRLARCVVGHVEEEALEEGLPCRGKALSAIVPVGSLERRSLLVLGPWPNSDLGFVPPSERVA